ncbi:MAG: phosphate ABC transporter substrate-binding protein [Thermoanaerobaculia bacterium]
MLILVPVLRATGADTYQMVVNSENPVTVVSRATVRNFYLGKTGRWPNGAPVKPIDLTETSSVRADFSKKVLGKDPADVKSHWLTLVFAGRGTPPVQFESDEKVLAMIRTSLGAIGYVSASASLGAGVKAVAVTD